MHGKWSIFRSSFLYFYDYSRIVQLWIIWLGLPPEYSHLGFMERRLSHMISTIMLKFILSQQKQRLPPVGGHMSEITLPGTPTTNPTLNPSRSHGENRLLNKSLLESLYDGSLKRIYPIQEPVAGIWIVKLNYTLDAAIYN